MIGSEFEKMLDLLGKMGDSEITKLRSYGSAPLGRCFSCPC
jgi:hypothetical protein